MNPGIALLDRAIRAEYAHVNFEVLEEQYTAYEMDYINLARLVLSCIKRKDFDGATDEIHAFGRLFLNDVSDPLELRARIRNMYDQCRAALELSGLQEGVNQVPIPEDLTQLNPPWFN